MPANLPIEGGPGSTGDRHVILIDRGSCKDYELYAAYPRGGTRGTPARGRSSICALNPCGPPGWTSADAAGLPIFPGLVRYDEVARGSIDHALRFTAPCTTRLRLSGTPQGLDL